jgi:hypothetical protein
VILAAFAVVVGVLTTRQLRGQFNDQVSSAADQLRGELHLEWLPNETLNCNRNTTVSLSDYVSAEHAQIRIFDRASGFVLCTQDKIRIRGTKQPPVTPAFPTPTRSGTFQELGYRVIVPRQLKVKPSGDVWLL